MHEVNVLDTSKPALDGHIHKACLALSIRVKCTNYLYQYVFIEINMYIIWISLLYFSIKIFLLYNNIIIILLLIIFKWSLDMLNSLITNHAEWNERFRLWLINEIIYLMYFELTIRNGMSDIELTYILWWTCSNRRLFGKVFVSMGPEFNKNTELKTNISVLYLFV